MEMRAIFPWRIYCPTRSDCREQEAQIAAQSLDRSHTFFQTIEFRICDVAASMEDTLAIAALCQALVATLTWLHKRGMSTHVLPRNFIDENKWRAMRYGLDAPQIDFVQERHLSMRDSISELLDFVDDVVDDLGSRCEINYLRTLLEDPRGTGADRQIAIYQQTGSVDAVVRYLMQQALQDVEAISSQQYAAN